MLWIMLPIASVSRQLTRPIEGTLVDIGVPVRVVYVLVGDVVVDFTATPSTTPSPAATPSRSEGHTGSEGKNTVAGRVINGRVRVDRRTIDDGRVVGGNVNHLGISLLNHDHLFAIDRLCFYVLLCCGF
jgi:hypothetical protein